jgi:hypothetical protein
VAVTRLLAQVVEELHASRLDLLSNAAGPVTLLSSVGEGLTTALGVRVFEAGFAIGPERQAGGCEMGLPVRFASRVIGALVCRWPIDRSVPADAADVLELAAVIIAPRLDSMRAAAHEVARAASAVPELLGISEAMANLRRAIVRAASAPFNVLIEGESGVGKELVARAVHQLSARRERKFCDVNCAALPEELLESELFGHARGAFSGAVVERAGLFEEADGGTLLLDEAADLSRARRRSCCASFSSRRSDAWGSRSAGRSTSALSLQRTETCARKPPRAGSGMTCSTDWTSSAFMSLHCATGRRTSRCWLTTVGIWRPRAQGSRARLSPATLNELSRYHWPGNVRELQNVVASLAVAAPTRGWVRPSLLPAVVSGAATVASGRLLEAREQFERRFVEVALARAGGNRAQAARALGVSRQGLKKILERLDLDQMRVETDVKVHRCSSAESC